MAGAPEGVRVVHAWSYRDIHVLGRAGQLDTAAGRSGVPVQES